jgi:hypothetical protein
LPVIFFHGVDAYQLDGAVACLHHQHFIAVDKVQSVLIHALTGFFDHLTHVSFEYRFPGHVVVDVDLSINDAGHQKVLRTLRANEVLNGFVRALELDAIEVFDQSQSSQVLLP